MVDGEWHVLMVAAADGGSGLGEFVTGAVALGVELNPNPGGVGFGSDSDSKDRVDSNPV